MMDQCWNHTRGRSTSGYGKVYARKAGYRTREAHRIVFAEYNGLREEDLPPVVRHTCDNPACYNPRHLVGGTVQDNSDDMVARGRSPKMSLNPGMPDQRLDKRAYGRERWRRIKEGTWNYR